MDRRLYYLEDTLFGQCTRENDREIRKRRNAFANSRFIGFDIRVRFAFDQIPLVDTNDQALLVLLNQRVDIEVLRLDTSRRVNHQDTYVAVFNRTDRTNN